MDHCPGTRRAPGASAEAGGSGTDGCTAPLLEHEPRAVGYGMGWVMAWGGYVGGGGYPCLLTTGLSGLSAIVDSGQQVSGRRFERQAVGSGQWALAMNHDASTKIDLEAVTSEVLNPGHV